MSRFGSVPFTVHSVIFSKNSMVYFQLNQKEGINNVGDRLSVGGTEKRLGWRGLREMRLKTKRRSMAAGKELGSLREGSS